ncbi:hypothetical protein [Faecalibaculum rodentium]|nr:hypothetical protein [Faecalibaculum rodentium]
MTKSEKKLFHLVADVITWPSELDKRVSQALDEVKVILGEVK